MNAPFPLFTLHPVADARAAWVALLLNMTPADDGSALARLFGEFGLAEALGPLPCVAVLSDEAAAAALPPEQAILCLPAALCCDRTRDESLRALCAKGFRLMANGLPAAGQSLCEGVDALALFVPMQKDPKVLAEWLVKLPGPHLASAAAKKAGGDGFQWFVGAAAEAAQRAPGKSSKAPNELLLLELLSQVANDADAHEIEQTIKRDPQLSYHLLRMVNSAAFSPTTKIASFSHAIALLGRRQLQRWLQLLMYSQAAVGAVNPLLPRAALRAALTEALCQATGGSQEDRDRAFMAGMFSLLDALFDKPLAEIMKPLNLADDVLSALLERSGPLGKLLGLVVASENAGDENIGPFLEAAGISRADWAHSLVPAYRWAIQISSEA